MDWVALSNTTFSASLALLGRYSRGGVDPLTIAIGQMIATQFTPSDEGNRRLVRAVQSCKGIASMGGTLWFGFGIKHIIHDLASTNHGLAFLGLLNVISETFTSSRSAELLYSLASALGSPEELRPSHFQWLAVVKACSGVLSASGFPIVADEMMAAIGGTHLYPGYDSDDTEVSRIANGLRSISQISKGDMANVTLIGGRACAWLAAVGNWLYGLSVRIIRDTDVVYETVQRNETAQINVQIYFLRDIKHGIGSTMPDIIYGTSHYVQIFSMIQRNNFYESRTSGRIEWKDCLKTILPKAWRKLSRNPSKHLFECLGRVIGCHARLLDIKKTGAVFRRFKVGITALFII